MQNGVPEYDIVAAGKGVTFTVKDAVFMLEVHPAVETSVNVAVPEYVVKGVQDASKVLLSGEKVPPAPLSDHTTAVVPRSILPPRLDSVEPWQIVVFDLTETHWAPALEELSTRTDINIKENLFILIVFLSYSWFSAVVFLVKISILKKHP